MPDRFELVLLIEYAPGAGIGWHRDRPVFGDVIGISLLAPARLRFRRRRGEKWERFSPRRGGCSSDAVAARNGRGFRRPPSPVRAMPCTVPLPTQGTPPSRRWAA